MSLAAPKKIFAVGLAISFLSPGPLFAQEFAAAVPSGDPAVFHIRIGSPLGGLAPAASFSGASLPGLIPSRIAVQTAPLAPGAAVVPDAASVHAIPGSARGLPAAAEESGSGPRESARQSVETAERALSGDPAAVRLRPGFGRLGADPVRAPTGAGPAGEKSASDEDFANRANIPGESSPVSVQSSPAPPTATVPPPAAPAPDEISEDAAALKPGRRKGGGPKDDGSSGGRRGGGHKRGDGDSAPPPADPKYPSDDITLNGTTLPSFAARPDRPIEPLIVQSIDATKESVLIAAYEFKSRPILNALRRAKARFDEENDKHRNDPHWIKKQVRVIVDFDAAFPRKYPGSDYTPHRALELQALLNEGFDVQILRGLWRYGIMHNKFMLLDGKAAEFGSYNFSWTSEEHHFENAKFTADAKHVQALAAFWNYLHGLSVPFEQARTHVWPKEVPPPPQNAPLSVEHNGVRLPEWFFSPGGNGEDWVVQALGSAKKTVVVSMFTFRSTRIAEALLAAKKRGVDVRVALDKSQFEDKSFDDARVYGEWLAHHKIKVRVRAGPNPDAPAIYEKNHNKFMVVDEALVETGSFNWTKNADLMNFENGFFTTDETDAKAYSQFFDDIFKKAEAIEAPADEPSLPTDEQLKQELLKEPEPLPPPTQWPEPPLAPKIAFNGESFPIYAFKPQHPVRDLLVQAIDASKKNILLALYEFDLTDVLDALRRAKTRFDAENAQHKGDPNWKTKKIQIVIDYKHVFPSGTDHTRSVRQRKAEIQALIDEGFDLHVRRGIGANGILHSKFAVFDEEMIEFGSYNWANTAEQDHFENAIFNKEKPRVDFYLKVWRYLYDDGVPFHQAEDYDWKNHKPGPPPHDDDLALDINGTPMPRSAASPNGGIEDIIIRAIHAARESIDIAMFSFYSQKIAEALLSAKQREVKVRLLFDENQSKLMKLDEWFAYHGFDVRISAGPDRYGNTYFQKMHNKFMIVDGKLLETGSFNYTPNAELHNFENANFFGIPEMIAGFVFEFEMMFNSADVSKPRKPEQAPALKSLPAQFFSEANDFLDDLFEDERDRADPAHFFG